ncbi:Selenoprotein O [Phytophthora fragariae]|uniref:Selenoprotein O n=2 Tax=Phytophthora fragariae TaxID=53985 RepID=A0A6A3VWW0_9STRA|nr:Selenoprotein O [Phytophthora fragariae]KAE8967161.1 Selenoprotein O [Phytophthora fragariae]KAE9066857.1 Selenoprotein O [Phytophthora fragariae]KAE9171536.1 Selenoprotein O [Phytophthora fragariae]KAE9174980.1 Selenoprotein O [Phytophthora fragariae]
MVRMAANNGRTRLSRSLSGWRRLPTAHFDNAVLRELPIDAEPKNFVRSAVTSACFSRVEPTPIASPELVVASPNSLLLAGIELIKGDDQVKSSDDRGISDELQQIDTLVPILAGNKLLAGSETAAQCYCGHQFGFFSGQLGDGAALYLGEIVTEGERWELQLKGSGLTPYSRTADGRKVLRSTLREFLCSESMFALGVPTTRAGSVVMSRETQVLRDVFYDGNAKMEPTAVVTRIAKSFLRFGSFEIFKDQDKFTSMAGPSAHLENKQEMMTTMLDFTIGQYFAEIEGENKYEQFFEEVVRRTAKLVAKWQTLGFCHGVLNTDNMSIVGDTLDYGPFGFMEHFDPKHICNTSDDRGRYRYEAQPEICKWNCGVLADQLGLVTDRAGLEPALEAFDAVYQVEYMRLMREKLGLSHLHGEEKEDKMLVDTLFDVLAHTGADFTCTFRYLSGLDVFDSGDSRERVLNQLVGVSETLAQQKRKLEQGSGGVSDAQFDMIVLLLNENPVRARQYGITHELIAQMKANRAQKEMLDATTDEERMDSIRLAWGNWIDVYISRIKEEGDAASDAERRRCMLKVNPLFVLRNHVAQKAIDLAHEGDYDGVQHIFELLTHPFDEPSDEGDLDYARPQDPSSAPLCVSCSS